MKEIVGREIAKRVNNGDVIGVGTGSTVDVALVAIGKRVDQEKLRVAAIPSSYESARRCEELGLQVLHPGSCDKIAWGFDGADAVDRKLRAIKGKGGALLQEKILAARCAEYLIIVDETKLCDNIAAKSAIPVEVIPEAVRIAEHGLKSLGAGAVELRAAVAKHGPVITEAGNLILDATFSAIQDDLEQKIKSLVGVVESGLFLNYATEVLVGGKQGVERLLRPR